MVVGRVDMGKNLADDRLDLTLLSPRNGLIDSDVVGDLVAGACKVCRSALASIETKGKK